MVTFGMVARWKTSTAGVEKVREQHLEETEDIHVDILDPSQVLEMLQDGEIIQALHAAPLWRYFCQHKN